MTQCQDHPGPVLTVFLWVLPLWEWTCWPELVSLSTLCRSLAASWNSPLQCRVTLLQPELHFRVVGLNDNSTHWSPHIVVITLPMRMSLGLDLEVQGSWLCWLETWTLAGAFAPHQMLLRQKCNSMGQIHNASLVRNFISLGSHYLVVHNIISRKCHSQ